MGNEQSSGERRGSNASAGNRGRRKSCAAALQAESGGGPRPPPALAGISLQQAVDVEVFTVIKSLTADENVACVSPERKSKHKVFLLPAMGTTKTKRKSFPLLLLLPFDILAPRSNSMLYSVLNTHSRCLQMQEMWPHIENNLHEILVETFLAIFADEPAVKARFFGAKALAAQDAAVGDGGENGAAGAPPPAPAGASSQPEASKSRRTSLVAGIRRRLSRASTSEDAGESLLLPRRGGGKHLLFSPRQTCLFLCGKWERVETH